MRKSILYFHTQCSHPHTHHMLVYRQAQTMTHVHACISTRINYLSVYVHVHVDMYVYTCAYQSSPACIYNKVNKFAPCMHS